MERIWAIDRLLRDRGALSLEEFLSVLEVSRATFRRDIDYLRDRLHATIVWDSLERKYRYDRNPATGRPHALPGVWFNESEIHALLGMQQLLAQIEPGLLATHIEPLKLKLISLLGEGQIHPGAVTDRIRLSPLARRRSRPVFFEAVASGLLLRRRLRITHHNRHTDETLTREISPQRLIYYRDNWYVDSWCHLREDLRSFALDALQAVIPLTALVREVPLDEVAARFDGGYGIFSGPTRHWARLRFSPYRARWVADEIWHQDQRGSHEPDGSYALEVPYNDPRELLADILRQGGECEVLAPVALRDMVRTEAARVAALYAG
jgi:predicted DNA-binding transcriptional regulator YafY